PQLVEGARVFADFREVFCHNARASDAAPVAHDVPATITARERRSIRSTSIFSNSGNRLEARCARGFARSFAFRDRSAQGKPDASRIRKALCAERIERHTSFSHLKDQPASGFPCTMIARKSGKPYLRRASSRSSPRFVTFAKAPLFR